MYLSCRLFDLLGRKNDIVLVELRKHPGVAVYRKALALVDETVYGDRAFTSVRDGVNGVHRTSRYISADKDVGLGSLECDLVTCDKLSVLGIDLRSVEDPAVLASLAYGDDNVGAFDSYRIVLIIYRSKSSGCVSYTEAFLEFHAGDLTVFPEYDLRTPAVV